MKNKERKMVDIKKKITKKKKINEIKSRNL